MKRKKLVATLAVLVLVIFAGVFSTVDMKASAASNSLSATYKCMYVGQSYTAKVKGSSGKVTWSTGNSNIASVNSSGKVTAKNIGRTNIYATVNGKKLTLKVEVVSETAYNAVNYAKNAVGCRYSQAKRMSKGCYDCGSLVWRAYASAGLYIGGQTNWAPTAASSASILDKTYKVISYSGVSASELLPGDLIYTSTRSNGRYRNITHAQIYVGNGKIVEAANSRVGVVKRNYSTKNVVLIARPTVKVSNKLQEPLLTSVKSKSSSTSNTTITVSWKKVSNAKGYYVYRKAVGGSYKKIATIKSKNTLTYTDKTAYAGNYVYTVKAYSGSKAGAYNSTGMTASTKLAVPSTISASNNTDGIKVTWSTVKYATGYKIYRKAEGGSYTLLKTISKQSTKSFQDKSVKSGVNYIYYVKAYRKNSSTSTTTSASSGNTKKVCYVDTTVVASKNTNSSTESAACTKASAVTLSLRNTCAAAETAAAETTTVKTTAVEATTVEAIAAETTTVKTTAVEAAAAETTAVETAAAETTEAETTVTETTATKAATESAAESSTCAPETVATESLETAESSAE